MVKVPPSFRTVEEIRKRIGRQRIQEILAKMLRGELKEEFTPLTPRTLIKYHKTVESFIYSVLISKTIKLPVFRVFTPIDNYTGAVYYIIKTLDEQNRTVIHVFRGTYGYYGSGPHDSAVIEEFLDEMDLIPENRSGDYLLGLLELI